MVCQQCQKRLANVQIVQNVNGKQIEIFLCSQCATNNEKVMFKMAPGIGGGIQMDLSDLLPGFMGFVNSMNQQKETACSFCHTTFSEFQKTGLLGCSQCYETFFNELSPVIARIQGNVEYKGKMPGETLENTKEIGQLPKLRKELKEAIAREDYELAATIRDKIREIEADGDNQEVGG